METNKYLGKRGQYRGTLRDDHTSDLSHLSTFFSHLNVIIGENLLLSFFSSTFEPKVLQSFISSQLTTWFCHNSQKTNMPPNTCTLLIIDLILLPPISSQHWIIGKNQIQLLQPVCKISCIYDLLTKSIGELFHFRGHISTGFLLGLY